MARANSLPVFPLALLFALVAGVLLIPLLILPHERIFGGTDALFYASLLKLTHAQNMGGDWWPRWLIDANAGTGFPLMYYYPPLPYLLTSALTYPLRWLEASLSTQLMAGLWASQLCAGIAAWLWLKTRFSTGPALTGAIFYVLLPYKFIALYLHVNLAGGWALALLPLVMLSCDGMLRGTKRGFAGFALTLALLAYTHPLTLLAFLPVPVLYVLWMGGLRMILTIAVGLAFAGALAAGYLVPFMGAKAWLAAGAFTEGKFNAVSNLGHIDALLSLFYPFLAAGTFITMVRLKRSARADERSQVPFWAGALLVLFLLTLTIARPLWENISLMAVFQFPFARLHAGMAVAAAWLIAWYAERAGNAAVPAYARPQVLFLFIAGAYIAVGAHVMRSYGAESDLTSAYVQEMQGTSILPYAGYHTQWGWLDGRAAYGMRKHLSALPQAWVAPEKGSVTVTEWKPGRIALRAEVQAEDTRVFVRQLYVPAWKVKNATRASVASDGEAGFMWLTLPAGTHNIVLELEPLPGQRVAEFISLIALLVCIGLMLPKAKHRA